MRGLDDYLLSSAAALGLRSPTAPAAPRTNRVIRTKVTKGCGARLPALYGHHRRAPYAKIIRYERVGPISRPNGGPTYYLHRFLHATKGWRTFSRVPADMGG